MPVLEKYTNVSGKRDFEIYGTLETIELFKKMYTLGARTSNFKNVFASAAKPMIQAARSNARKSKFRGHLWKSIKLLTSRRYKGVFWIGPTRKKSAPHRGYHGWWIEHGTNERKGGRGRISAKPYMEPAYTAHKQEVRRRIDQEFYKEIYKLIGKKLSA